MAAKLIITRGLPASGKSTWAKAYVDQNPGTVNVCKDDLRQMLFNYTFSRKKERFVENARDFLVDAALQRGLVVISSDTNLNKVHIERMQEIAAKYGADVEVKEFSISLEDAIARDRERATKPGERSVGQKVIKDMYYKWIAPSGRQ